jgi:SSS family solute:Na+ symporter
MRDSKNFRADRRDAAFWLAGPVLWLAMTVVFCRAAEPPAPPASFPRPVLASYFGKAPKLDGTLSPGEWRDATVFHGVKDWVPEFSPVTRDEDSALTGYVKHDRAWLYFAFDVTDDLLYGIDTERWLPDENPKAHELSRDGFPWFGDEMELLINAPKTWQGEEDAAGDGSSWQMVCNLTKSRLGGIGIGGLLEGEPRSKPAAWDTYQRWIKAGAQKAVAKAKPGGKGFIIEWAVRFNPCLEIAPGKFYDTKLGTRDMGLNIALGDLDDKATGKGNFGNFHHEQWLAGVPHLRTQKRYWGTLRVMGTVRK